METTSTIYTMGTYTLLTMITGTSTSNSVVVMVFGDN